jgi:hypothetical protein
MFEPKPRGWLGVLCWMHSRSMPTKKKEINIHEAKPVSNIICPVSPQLHLDRHSLSTHLPYSSLVA